MHLKRFQQNARGRPRKIEDAVAFPLHLDMGAFCEPAAPGSPTVYTLVGMIEHMGRSVSSGHYIAFVSRPAGAPQALNPEDRADPSAAQPAPAAAHAESADRDGKACSGAYRAHDGMRPAAEAVEAGSADAGRESLCAEAGEGAPAASPVLAVGGKGRSVPNGQAMHPEPQGPGMRSREQAADPQPASLQPQGKGSPAGGSGGATDGTAQRSAVASGAHAAGGCGGAADRVWWRVSDTQVRAVDWETVAQGQAYILMYVRGGEP